MFRRKGSIEIKSPDQLAIMREAGRVVGTTLQLVANAVRPGITTAELNELAAASISDLGAVPSFLGYNGFPAVLCTSINNEVVHGIPGPTVLREGDLLSVDCGAIVDGWHGDAAISVPVGSVSPRVAELSAATEAAMWAGLGSARVGAHLSDIGHAVESSLRASGAYGNVEDYGGHGIGSRMHMDPHVANYGKPGTGPLLVPGMALAIEPMATLGDPEITVLEDGWTVVTVDGQWAAHWEHTVAITEDGPWVLTAVDETRL